MTSNVNKEELRKKLRSKLQEKQILRQDKIIKKQIFDKTLKDNGIDKDKLEDSIKILKKAGLVDKNNKTNQGINELISKLAPNEQKLMEEILKGGKPKND
jgi:translation initiation factor IF-2